MKRSANNIVEVEDVARGSSRSLDMRQLQFGAGIGRSRDLWLQEMSVTPWLYWL